MAAALDSTDRSDDVSAGDPKLDEATKKTQPVEGSHCAALRRRAVYEPPWCGYQVL